MTTVALAACRAGFEELPPEAPEPAHVGTDHGAIDERDLFDGLVLWYQLDEVAATNRVLDASGYELHGRCRSTCPAITEGYIEAAADFATTTLVDAPRLGKLEIYTVSAWVWLPKIAPPATPPCFVRETTSGVNVWRICASAAEIRFVTGAHTLPIVAPMPTEQWVHVAVRWDQSKKTIFVNGVEHGSAVASGTLSPVQLSIGGADVNVDDVRIYSRALNHDELGSLYERIE